MPSTITLFEHEPEPYKWTDREVTDLEKMRQGTSPILHPTTAGDRRVLRAAQHVGVVRLGNQTIQILPKIYQSAESADKAVRAREATRNLLHMLACAGNLQIREHAIASLMKRDSNWFEILTRLFASHLLEEWQRGAHQSYHVVEDDIPVLKGKWRIAQQLRRPDRKHILSVSYDEFSPDNKLNRVLRYVVERLWHATRDSENRRQLSLLRQGMEDVTLLSCVHAQDAAPGLLSRLNRRYEPLLNLARLFLDYDSIQTASGSMQSFAFTFDMNGLFEMFLVNFIRRHVYEVIPEDLKTCVLLPQTQGNNLHLAQTETGNKVFLLRPDLAFRCGISYPLLIDAKYKILDEASRGKGVSRDDFYQMFAYAHRYECPRVLLVYPQTAGMRRPVRARFLLEGGHGVIEVATINITVPLANYEGRARLIGEMASILKGEAFNATSCS